MSMSSPATTLPTALCTLEEEAEAEPCIPGEMGGYRGEMGVTKGYWGLQRGNGE